MKNRLRLSLFDHSVFSTRILYNNAFISIIRICQLKPFENAFRFIHMLIWLPSSFRSLIGNLVTLNAALQLNTPNQS